jgi:hypothetical protein
MNIAHFRSFLRNKKLHQVACRCRGKGFRYHILGIGH